MLCRLGEGCGDVPKRADRDTINRIHDACPESVAVSIHGIGKDSAEHDILRTLQVEMAFHKLVECPADAEVTVSDHLDEIAVERLEKESSMQQVSGSRVIGLGLHPEGPCSLKGELEHDPFPVPEHVEADFITVKFPFHDLRHVDRLAVKIDATVAGDRMPVDGEQDVILA